MEISVVIDQPRIQLDLSSPIESHEIVVFQNQLNGRSVELTLNDYILYYRFVGDTNWIELGNIRGATGEAGKTVELTLSDFILYWRYVGDTNWIALGNIRGPQGNPGPDRIPTTGSGPVLLNNGAVAIGRRVDTWANRGTGLFTGEILIITDLKTAFYWNGARWRPTQSRVRVFSNTTLSPVGLGTSETVVRTVSIPAGLCEVGCIVRVIGVSTWSSTSSSAKLIALKASNNPNANLSLLSSIANRSRSVISGTGYYGFNKPLVIRSQSQLWTGTTNIDIEASGSEGLSPIFISGIDCTEAWTLWLTHTKPLANDTFDSQYFIVEIEYP